MSVDYFLLVSTSMGGCFGCCAKLSRLLTVDDPSKGLASQGRTAKRASTADDIWSTSAGKMDLSGEQSQRSFSSIMTLNQPFHPYTNDGSTSNSFEFLNPGLLLWKQTRQQWLANKRSPNKTQVRELIIRKWWIFLLIFGNMKAHMTKISWQFLQVLSPHSKYSLSFFL